MFKSCQYASSEHVYANQFEILVVDDPQIWFYAREVIFWPLTGWTKRRYVKVIRPCLVEEVFEPFGIANSICQLLTHIWILRVGRKADLARRDRNTGLLALVSPPRIAQVRLYDLAGCFIA